MQSARTLFIGLMVGCCNLALAQDPTQVERPDLKAGHAWTYAILDPISKVESGQFELIIQAVDENQFQASITGARPGEAAYDRNWAVKKLPGIEFSTPMQLLSFPLQVGKKWQYTSTFNHQQCSASTFKLAAEVIGWENVTVPAGTFRALRVDHSGGLSNSCGGGVQTYKIWYVPSLKTYARRESRFEPRSGPRGGDTHELKKFKID